MKILFFSILFAQVGFADTKSTLESPKNVPQYGGGYYLGTAAGSFLGFGTPYYITGRTTRGVIFSVVDSYLIYEGVRAWLSDDDDKRTGKERDFDKRLVTLHYASRAFQLGDTWWYMTQENQKGLTFKIRPTSQGLSLNLSYSF